MGLVSTESLFLERACEFGIAVTPAMMQSLVKYSDLLLRWNRRINLTATMDRQGILLGHILDSLVPVSILKGASRVADVGSGAGFPGIPLKIAMPEVEMVLIESTRKKASFLDHVITQLRLTGIHVIWGRVEEDTVRMRFETEPVDALISRAALSFRMVLEAGGMLVKRDGRIVLMKGILSGDDIASLREACKPGNWLIANNLPYRLPGMNKDRSLIVVLHQECFT